MDTDGGRCPWADASPGMRAYHDIEWGVPVHDERRLFELLTLEGAQAGLSWSTVLAKRDNYRRLFDGFDPGAVAAYDEDRIASLLADPGIVRHRQKVRSTVTNARAWLDLTGEAGSVDAWLWAWVDGRPVDNAPATPADVPATSPLATVMSRDLRRRGFAFVGPTIVYSFLQAAGLVDDHLRACPARRRHP